MLAWGRVLVPPDNNAAAVGNTGIHSKSAPDSHHSFHLKPALSISISISSNMKNSLSERDTLNPERCLPTNLKNNNALKRKN